MGKITKKLFLKFLLLICIHLIVSPISCGATTLFTPEESTFYAESTHQASVLTLRHRTKIPVGLQEGVAQHVVISAGTPLQEVPSHISEKRTEIGLPPKIPFEQKDVLLQHLPWYRLEEVVEMTPPIMGKMNQIFVSAGQIVTDMTPLCILECMKMLCTMICPVSGVVEDVYVKESTILSDTTPYLSIRLDTPTWNELDLPQLSEHQPLLENLFPFEYASLPAKNLPTALPERLTLPSNIPHPTNRDATTDENLMASDELPLPKDTRENLPALGKKVEIIPEVLFHPTKTVEKAYVVPPILRKNIDFSTSPPSLDEMRESLSRREKTEYTPKGMPTTVCNIETIPFIRTAPSPLIKAHLQIHPFKPVVFLSIPSGHSGSARLSYPPSLLEQVGSPMLNLPLSSDWTLKLVALAFLLLLLRLHPQVFFSASYFNRYALMEALSPHNSNFFKVSEPFPRKKLRWG